MDKFYKDLKVGDLVILSKRCTDHVVRVERLTKTLIVLDTGHRFRRDTGSHFGGSMWYSISINEATPQSIENVRIKKERMDNIEFVEDFNMRNLSNHDLRQLKIFLKSAGEKNERN